MTNPTEREMTTITVTEWRHPSTDSFLILAGTPNETREEASQYFLNDATTMVSRQTEMDTEQFHNLPEFEG